jgi:hypothetical protein
MSEKPDVGNACVSQFARKKILMSALAEFGGKFVRQMAAIKSSGNSSAAKTRWLRVS